MERINKFNYWLGIVVTAALLLESAFGIYSFVHSKQQARSFQSNFLQNRPNFNGGNGSESASNGSNGAPQFGGGTSSQNSGQRPSGIRARSGAQASPIQLVIHIVSLILAAASLVMTAIIGKNNARKRKELMEQEKGTQE
ncbi:hypothetical protein NIE88_08855 [Sporolactobacillus shoreicorticis]|uniref:Uncharacterized protein n=1 Tax=Sporolactobacillus shoreicorticis TaxID=1923877 RepID=A0ABW5S2N1_9BACL|nr:hypothetical protein [Sporolactobacillus shoreicorticis]MCO7125880.1 hypothetical protein [Sporolactobacillus shoreicorticis]